MANSHLYGGIVRAVRGDWDVFIGMCTCGRNRCDKWSVITGRTRNRRCELFYIIMMNRYIRYDIDHIDTELVMISRERSNARSLLL